MEVNNLEIIAFHGWGFDHTFWDHWKRTLPDAITFKTADRGYFGNPHIPKFSPSQKKDSLKLLFTHSFGLHWCPDKLLEWADFIIVFNGFRHFIPNEEAIKRKADRKLKRMISAFEKDPHQVLKNFWEGCFYPGKNQFTKSEELNKKLMLSDLKELMKSDVDNRFQSNSKINGRFICLDGGNDKILEYPMGKAFCDENSEGSIYHFIPEAGHALPATHTRDCWSFISAMIPIFKTHENYRDTSA